VPEPCGLYCCFFKSEYLTLQYLRP
jgi:hypothetical protein